jgi:very-short-patch-repair endonuclease
MRKDTPEYVKGLAKQLRKDQTEAEKNLWENLRKDKIAGYNFRRQYPIGRYIADFYCSKANLVIEIDGKVHNGIEQKEYDKIREQEIKNRLIKIIRITNEEVFDNLDKVIEKIKRIVKANATESD